MQRYGLPLHLLLWSYTSLLVSITIARRYDLSLWPCAVTVHASAELQESNMVGPCEWTFDSLLGSCL